MEVLETAIPHPLLITGIPLASLLNDPITPSFRLYRL